MSDVKISWSDPNQVELGYNVYRSHIPIDINNPPVPVATLGPNSIQYIDNKQTVGDLLYYRVSAVGGNFEIFSVEVQVEVGKNTAKMLDIFGDGTTVSTLNLNGNIDDLNGQDTATFHTGTGTYQLISPIPSFEQSLATPTNILTLDPTIWDFSSPNGFSFSIWCYTTQTRGDWQSIITNGYSTGLKLRWGGSGINRIRLDLNNTNINSTYLPSPNTWFMLTVSYDRLLNKCDIYINKTLNVTSNVMSNFTGLSTSPIYVGRGDTNLDGGQRWFGAFSQLRFINRGITAEEVETIYNDSRE